MGEVALRSKLDKALKSVNAQLEKLEEINDSKYQTTGEFKWAPSSSSISCDIHDCDDIHLLISIHSSLYTKKMDYEASAKILKIETFPVYKWQGTEIDKWLHDIGLRIKIVGRHALEKDLKEKKKVLESHLDEDQRLANTLAELGF